MKLKNKIDMFLSEDMFRMKKPSDTEEMHDILSQVMYGINLVNQYLPKDHPKKKQMKKVLKSIVTFTQGLDI